MFPRVEFEVEVFCQRLREKYDTVVTPGKFFGAEKNLRIGVGGEAEVFAEGLNRIHDSLVSHSN